MDSSPHSASDYCGMAVPIQTYPCGNPDNPYYTRKNKGMTPTVRMTRPYSDLRHFLCLSPSVRSDKRKNHAAGYHSRYLQSCCLSLSHTLRVRSIHCCTHWPHLQTVSDRSMVERSVPLSYVSNKIQQRISMRSLHPT